MHQEGIVVEVEGEALWALGLQLLLGLLVGNCCRAAVSSNIETMGGNVGMWYGQPGHPKGRSAGTQLARVGEACK